jgi:hypothetical protein
VRRAVGRRPVAKGVVLPEPERLRLHDRVPERVAVRAVPVRLLEAVAKPGAARAQHSTRQAGHKPLLQAGEAA